VSLKFRRFFDLWDTNGDGFLSHNERLTEAMNLHSIVTVQILPKALTNWTASSFFFFLKKNLHLNISLT